VKIHFCPIISKDVFEEKNKVHQIQRAYTFENFKEYKVLETYLHDKTLKHEFESFIDELSKKIFGDCITSSFHVLEKLCKESISPSYIEG